MVSYLLGPVSAVAVEPNKPLRAGDGLFRIDPPNYEFTVRKSQKAQSPAGRTSSSAADKVAKTRDSDRLHRPDRKGITCALPAGR